jgi:ABC-type multidrug transport system ATPase subunit
MLSWENVHVKAKTTTIIEHVSGHLKTGEMMAIIGGSGAGKTTLLNVLAHRHRSGKVVKGRVFFNTYSPKQDKIWRKLVAYVEQEDIHYLQLTPRESWTYHARLVLAGLDKEQTKVLVEQVAHDLSMEHVMDRKIQLLSGGEKKRVSIGTQLLGAPRILVLDEPTSGLDAFTALMVVTMLRRIATEKRMVVLMTIHQPRENIIDLFDRVYCLKVLSRQRLRMFLEPSTLSCLQ